MRHKHTWDCPHCEIGVFSDQDYSDLLELKNKHIKTHMKQLKKHPKQQRMEEMNIPGSNKKPSRLVHKDTLSVFNDLDQDVQKDMLRSVRAIRKEKILYSGELKTRKVANEEMTFPITKPNKKVRQVKHCFFHPLEPAIRTGEKKWDFLCQTCVDAIQSLQGKGQDTAMWRFDSSTTMTELCLMCGSVKTPYHCLVCPGVKREYLRSINDDLGFTLMPRIVWRVVAVGVLVGAVIYFLSKAL